MSALVWTILAVMLVLVANSVFLVLAMPGQRITHDNAPHKYTRSHQDPLSPQSSQVYLSLMTQCTFLSPGSGQDRSSGEHECVTLALTSPPPDITHHNIQASEFVHLPRSSSHQEMSPPTPSPGLSPSSDRSEVSEPPVATHCEFHLCVNKFWLVELLPLPPPGFVQT